MDNETSDILNNDTSLKTEKFSDNSSLQSRPKLRKFKRPKMGQMPSAPVAPEKGHFVARQGLALLTLIPIWLYGGKQGYHSRALQYSYYAFYPLHLLILSILKFL